MMKKEPQKAASHDCVHCNDAFKTDVTVKDKSHIAAVASFSTLTSERAISLVSVNAVKSLYVNGPPGPMHVVPLYLQLHTLRI